MNKRVLIICATVIVIIVFAVFLFSRKQSGENPTAQPPLAQFGPTGGLVQPPNVAFSFTTQPNIPASLPIYSYQPPSLTATEKLAESAAAKLNLSATPSALTRGGSYTKTWSRPNEAALTVTQTGDTITIGYRQAKTNDRPGVLSPDVAVQQFLLALVPPITNISLRAAGTESGPFNGLLVLDTPPPASYKNYFFSFVMNSYPILTADLSLSPISVIADGGGIIRFANIFPPPSQIQVGNSTPLLTADQVLASLSAGRGTILDTHNPQTPDQGAVPNFSKLVIDNARVVYAPQGNQLVPALYLTGTGTSASGATQQATIFLWLVQENTTNQP